MKIIDLLNRIVNNEALPEKIKYDDKIYKLEDGVYFNVKDFIDRLIDNIYPDFHDLSNEVEVLNVDEKENIEELDTKSLNGLDGFTLTATEEVYIDKINEIIRAVNKMLLDKNN